MLSREIRQKIIKTIQTITIKNLNDDLKENLSIHAKRTDNILFLIGRIS